MQTVTTIGLDIAKSVFQVHGVDAAGQVVVRRQLKRRYVLAFFQKLPPCLIGIEVCASSHYWSRELRALGHTVRLMPPAYVKPYVKRQKNDATDAEAICEAVTRANMRFVPTKTPERGHHDQDRRIPQFANDCIVWARIATSDDQREQFLQLAKKWMRDAESIDQGIELRPKEAAKAAEMAGEEIDRLGDPLITDEERQLRKEGLIKGPQEFRDIRSNRAKIKPGFPE